MCLIVFAWQPDQPQALLLAANRDEFHARPSSALAQWPDAPEVYAGRDLQAGGTWLGVNPQGRFAALTNIRDPHAAQGARSRGELPAGFLRSRLSASDYLTQLLPTLEQYSGFNLLLGDRQQLYYLNSVEGVIHALKPGLYGLSNAELDSPWPKLLSRRHAFAQLNNSHSAISPDALLALMNQRQRADDADLPNTGVGLRLERMLSAAFIVSEDYGTRVSSALILQREGGLSLNERSFNPDGKPLGERQITLGC